MGLLVWSQVELNMVDVVEEQARSDEAPPVVLKEETPAVSPKVVKEEPVARSRLFGAFAQARGFLSYVHSYVRRGRKR